MSEANDLGNIALGIATYLRNNDALKGDYFHQRLEEKGVYGIFKGAPDSLNTGLVAAVFKIGDSVLAISEDEGVISQNVLVKLVEKYADCERF